MNLYISDLHFGHNNVIGFDHRPYVDSEEMDQDMIKRWNERVNDVDDVWILGDFCYRSNLDPSWYLKQLKGKKHLINGNHDKAILDNNNVYKYFESIDKMTYIKDANNLIVMCHFPLCEWNGMHHGAWHMYGHIHNRKDDTYEFMKTRERSLNVGCMINDFTPVSFDELIINNKKFQEKDNKTL